MTDLATLTGGILDPATLDALLADLATCTTLGEVRCRQRTGGYAGTGTFAQVRADLAAGHAVQIAYAWDGGRWIDTLIPGPGGVRLVRTRIPDHA
ncbi:MAG: hypothetical protein RLZZ127_2152 [Planctomycetota bacterium]|jgi:hypothetical protein